MSGIVGILNSDASPVDPALLERMTGAMAYRGPDGCRTRVIGPVGLGHVLLRTTDDARDEQQPLSLDGQSWLVADARIDARDELIDKLAASGIRGVCRDAADGELILHAYRCWGWQCVGHLMGDFAFAVWDQPGRVLFCARDPFGVKPFYYAQVGAGLVFGNTLECLRQHPQVSQRLNDQAIGDFLLFGYNQDLATTSFADIQRLPPAHCLRWCGGAVRPRRYWRLPEPAPIRYRRAGDYVAHFQHLLRQAVEDRLRTNRVGVYMSGGLDSTLLAATAKQGLARRYASFDLHAHTVVYDSLIPDRERHFSRLAGDAIGIPVHYVVADGYRLFERWDEPGLSRPEPIDWAQAALFADLEHTVASRSRVALTGLDGDAVLSASVLAHFGELLKRRRLGAVARDVVGYLRARRCLPIHRLLAGCNRGGGSGSAWPVAAACLRSRLVAELGLRERWDQMQAPAAAPSGPRARAYRALSSPIWAHLLEAQDPGVTRLALESRHPLIDVRLIEYLLAIPPVPWCVGKELFRVAARGILPRCVRRRPKSPLAAEPVPALLRRDGSAWAQRLADAPGLGRYVDVNLVPPLSGDEEPDSLWLVLRVHCLGHWLRQLASAAPVSGQCRRIPDEVRSEEDRAQALSPA